MELIVYIFVHVAIIHHDFLYLRQFFKSFVDAAAHKKIMKNKIKNIVQYQISWWTSSLSSTLVWWWEDDPQKNN